jgi:ribonuclease P protein component
VNRRHRILKDADFKKIIAEKKLIKSPQFIIYGVKQTLGLSRFGLSVSKKVGEAVVRNRIRRQLRMIIQENIDLNLGIDHIIIVRGEYLNHSFIDNKTNLIQSLGLLRRKVA